MKTYEPGYLRNCPAPHRKEDLKPGSGNPEQPGTIEERLVEKAREVIALAPEIRSEKVARLESAIKQKDYRIEASKIAQSLIICAVWESR